MMTRRISKKRTQDDEGTSNCRVAKRAKSTSELEQQESSGPVVQRKLNRLQRATPKETRQSATRTGVAAAKLKKAEKKKGLLSRLLDAPIDIFYEVLTHLLPADLLNVSRVSHQLRELLLSRSVRQIWIGSLAHTDLPPCPEGLTEPQYASLVFDTECNACGTPHIRTINTKLKVRLCKDCYALNVIEFCIIYEAFLTFLGPGVNLELMKIVETAALCVPCVEGKGASDHLYYRPDALDALIECLTNLHHMTSEDFVAFVEERAQQMVDGLSHAAKLQDWIESKATERSSELQELAEKHERDVKSKLRDLGYVEEDWNFEINRFAHWDDMEKWEKMVCQKRQLTDRTWKTLRPKLTKFLDERRSVIKVIKRRAEFTKEYNNHFEHVCLTFGECIFMPEADDLMQHERIKSFVFYDDSERAITPEVWLAFLPTLLEILSQQRDLVLSNHAEAVSKRRSESKTGDEVCSIDPLQQLTLASCFFRNYNYEDDEYHKGLYYFNSIDCPGLFPDIRDDRSQLRAPWPTEAEYIQILNVEIADALLVDLALPLTTKMSEMQAMGERFVCCRCDPVFKKVMSWSEVVRHFVNESDVHSKMREMSKCEELGIKFIEDHSPEDKSRLLKIMDDEEKISITEGYKAQSSLASIYHCKLCYDLGMGQRKKMTEPQMKIHIRTKHDREPVQEHYQADGIGSCFFTQLDDFFNV